VSSSSENTIVIVGAARTPMGGLQGALGNVPAPELGAIATRVALEKSGVSTDAVEELLMGCVLPAGLGQAPARQVALQAGLALSTQCTTVNKVCGSGMKTVLMAHDQIKAGSCSVAVAGGMESMTLAPYLMPNARTGLRAGHKQVYDHMFLDALEDPKSGSAMGSFAQAIADKYRISREDMDAYAVASLQRANQAIENGDFIEEVAPVTVKSRKGEEVVTIDEQPGNAKVDKIPKLKPAFAKDGTITAANSSSISDGAAALVLMRESDAIAQGLPPLARIVAHSSHAIEPKDFPVAPVGSIEKVLSKAGWSAGEVDLFEVNEAFAVVAMLAMKQLNIPHDKMNIHGGACALGHPVGASGARIIVTLIHALKRLNKQKGVASICIGGGEATSIAVEVM